MSRINTAFAASAAIVTACFMVSGASAQGYGHHHAPKVHVCYEKISTPDVYGTVKKQVLVKAGEWEVQKEPAVYVTKERQVLVEHGREIVHVTPPTFKIEKTTHKVHDGYGHAKYVTHATKVRVDDGKKSVEKTEDVYKTEKYTVLVRPEKVTKIWHQPVYNYVEEKVLVKHGHTFIKPFHKPYGQAC